MPHRATLAAVSAIALLGACHSKRDPEQLRREGLERAQANLRELDTLQKLGNDLQLQGKCTPAAVIAAKDPDRQYLACFGVNGGAGANPRLIEFGERYGTDAAGLARGCAEIQESEWVGVVQIYCALARERKVAEARLLRAEYQKANRCTNAAIRGAADPDFHYLVCYGHAQDELGVYYDRQKGLTVHDQTPRLNVFRDRYGPALETIRTQCPELRRGIQEYRKPRGIGSPPPAGPAAEFETAYTVYCTD
jgi:hypothetical protein